jgi:GT2 family glycosyltransferase
MNDKYTYDDLEKAYNAITVVMVIKNREKIRFEKCLRSLLEQTHECKVLVIDYGSDKENVEWERESIKQFPNATLIEVTRDTDVFNKSRALNIGFKYATTKYILSSDIDIIYSPNFIEEVMKALTTNPKSLVLCQKIDLDREGKETEVHEPSASGSCIGIDAFWLDEVHGYDEVYTYWGREDNDLVDRAVASGYQVVWITDKTKMWHQWHKPANRPSLEDNTWYYQIPSKPIMRNANGWGEL